MKKVILYVRVSTQQQALNGYSIDTQIDKLRSYAKLKDYENIIVLSDNGFSGKNTSRPSFKRMIELVEKNEVEAIIIYSISRFARNIVDTLKTIELLNKHSVAFHSLTENIDTTSATGRFFINILASLSQLEREQIGERTKAVLQYKKSINEKVGQVSFGFTDKNKKLVINRSEQNTLQLIKILRDKDEFTFEQIANELIKRNRKNKSGKVLWNKSMIYKLYYR